LESQASFPPNADAADFPPPPAALDQPPDLGFGALVARESRQRLLNRDGSFNVVREGLTPFASLSIYHLLLTISWPRFLGLVTGSYLLINALFGAAYAALGPGAIAGYQAAPALSSRLLRGFFFSVQTFATIGYGQMAPASLAANLLVTVESLVGLLGFALATGLLFARFSRPIAKILYSQSALVAPYRGSTGFMFRIVNARSNQLIELQAEVLFSRRHASGAREFHQLALERTQVPLFPLSWTVVHPITPESPLHGISEEDLLASDAEFDIILTAIDETFFQTVHSRSSYKAEEVVWNARFANILDLERDDGRLGVDISRIHDLERSLAP
jgi:inward rectifier potassium channel